MNHRPPNSGHRWLGELDEAARVLDRPDELLATVTEVLNETCPRGLGYVYTLSGNGFPTLDRTSGRLGGQPVDLSGWRDAYVLGRVGYDRSRVQSSQRNRWVEPVGLHVPLSTFRQDPIYRVIRPFGVCRLGRVLVCSGASPLACVGVALPDGDSGFSPTDRGRIYEVAQRASLPLSMTVRWSWRDAQCSALDHWLKHSSVPTFVFRDDGGLVAASSDGIALLSRDPEVAVAMTNLVRRQRAGRHALVLGAPCSIVLTPIQDRGNTRSSWVVTVEVASTKTRDIELTRRQQEILSLVASGLTNRETGAQLGIEASSVKTTLDRLFVRAGVRRRAALVRWWSTIMQNKE